MHIQNNEKTVVMKNLKVSVITPIYNRREFCQSALKFLRAQTLQYIEFIIVDDGSTDGSYEYLVKNTKFDKRFKIFKMNKNSGPSVARNLALKHVSGEYIGFFDIDDEIPADYFESLLNTAVQNKSDIVFASYNNIPHIKTGNINQLCDKIGCLRNGSLWDKLFLFNLIKQHNIEFPIGRYCADNVFVFTAFYYANQITLCNQPVYKYILRQDSIGIDTKKREKRKVDALYITQQIMEFIKNNKFDDISLDACYYFLTKSLNSYKLDKDFIHSFDVLIREITPKGVKANRKKTKVSLKMMFLKLKRMFGIISRQTYNERLLCHKMEKSGLFDAKWYLAQNPDVKRAKVNPVRHYFEFGWTEGRNPSPKFDNNAYLSMHSDVAAAKVCPLVHYIEFGRDEGRLIKPVNGAAKRLSKPRSLSEKLQYAWEYPIRAHDEYHKLKDKIKNLKNSK